MADIPDHLLKRSAERRKALGLPAKEGDGEAVEEAAPDAPVEAAAEAPPDAPTAAETPGATAPAAGGGESKGGVPAHLLERAARRRAALTGGGDGGAAVPAATAAGGTATATATRTIAAPTATGPGGHTQRLLTVVKSGSIQQTKAEAQDKVHTWPHLLVVEFACVLAVTVILLIFSAVVRAPLLSLADVNQTPNPSKAPWYFLGLQELLTMFHPMVAGVTIPGVGLFLLMASPYVDKNPSQKPNDRKFMISMFTIFLMLWAVLVIIGSFFRGTGFNFVFPWKDGIFFEL
jgi:menaquinol-cytochrome c reductase cytochrome b/c subunit